MATEMRRAEARSERMGRMPDLVAEALQSVGQSRSDDGTVDALRGGEVLPGSKGLPGGRGRCEEDYDHRRRTARDDELPGQVGHVSMASTIMSLRRACGVVNAAARITRPRRADLVKPHK